MKKIQNSKNEFNIKNPQTRILLHTCSFKGNKNNNVQNVSSVYVAKLGNECLNNICQNATDYVNNKITNVISNLIFYKILRREIPKWNGSSCRVFPKGTLSLLESPRRALPFEPALRSEGQILPYWLL